MGALCKHTAYSRFPVGTPAPGALVWMVTVKVKPCDAMSELGKPVTVVDVVALFTGWISEAVAADLKFASFSVAVTV